MHNEGRSSSTSSSIDAGSSSPNSVADDGETTQSSPLSEGSSKGTKRAHEREEITGDKRRRLDDAVTPALASIDETQIQRPQTSVDDAWDAFFKYALNERKQREAELEGNPGKKEKKSDEIEVNAEKEIASSGEQNAAVTGTSLCGFLLRTWTKDKSRFELNLICQSSISLQDTIEKYGSENILLKTRDGIYKTPDAYNRSEPDTAGRAFLISTGWPSEVVRAEYDRYVSVETYQKLLNDPAWNPKRPFPMDPEKLDTRTLDRTGFSYTTPSLPSAIKPEFTHDGIVEKDLSPVLVDGPTTWGFYKGELLGGEKFEAVRNSIPLEHRLVVGLNMSGKDSGTHLRLIDFMRLCKEANVLPSRQQLRLCVQAAASRLSAEPERDPSAPLGETGTSGARLSRFDRDSPKRNLNPRDRTKPNSR